MIYLAEIEYYDPADDSANKLYWSEDLTQDKTWLNFKQGLVAVTANTVAAPDSTLTADTLTLNSTGTRYQPVRVESGVTYTYSLALKLGTASKSIYWGVWNPSAAWIVGLDPGDAALDALSASAWTRLSVTFTAAATQTVWLLLPWASGTNDNKTVQAWGALFNIGASPITYARTDAAPTRLLRVATQDYTSLSTDSPPFMLYPGRLSQPGLMRRDIYAPGMTGGLVTPSYGLVELAHEGELDFLSECGVDGRAYTLKTLQPGASLSTATTVLKAVIEQVDIQRTRVTLRLKDRLNLLEKPASRNTYTGASGSSVEGAVQLAGRRKPFIVGHVHNTSPVLVNEARLIYQIHDGVIEGGSYFDNGVNLNREAPYASLTEMESTWPSAGCFREYLPLGLVRIGLLPSGAFTGWAAVYGTGLPGTALKTLAIAAGWPTDAINDSDVTALDNAGAANWIGYFIDGNDTALDVMRRLAAGYGFWFGPDALGVLRMGLLEPPAGTPAMTLTDAHIVKIERLPSDIPVNAVTVRYDKNWTVQTDLASAITAERREWLKTEWRQVTAEIPANLMKHPLGTTLEMDSYLVVRDGAKALAERMLSLLGVNRERYSLTVRLDDLPAIDLNAVVNVQTDRFGLDSGKLLRVLGLQADHRTRSLELILWG